MARAEYDVTLFCAEGCPPCRTVLPDFEAARASGKYRKGALKVNKLLLDDDYDDVEIEAFPTLALTHRSTGKVARKKNKEPVVLPLIGGVAIKKGLAAFLRAHAPAAPLEFAGDF